MGHIATKEMSRCNRGNYKKPQPIKMRTSEFLVPSPKWCINSSIQRSQQYRSRKITRTKKEKKESVERISIGEMSENISMKYHQYDCLNKHWTRTIPIHFPPWLLGRWGYFLWCFNRNLKVVKSDRSRRKYCSPEESSQIAYPIQ